MQPEGLPRVDVLGCPVLRIPKSRLLGALEAAIEEGIPGKQVVTLNVDIAVLALDDAELGAVIRSAAFVVADGVPLIWYSKWVGLPIPERINGTDLCDDVARLSGELGWKLFLLGSTPGSCEGTIAALRHRHPSVVIAGSYQPPFGDWSPEEEKRMAAAVRATHADLVLVGFGTPRQECWIRRHGAASGASVLIGVGGSFDILSGRLRRAPRWLQQHGFEWSWRLMLEPRRLARRYLVRDLRFLVEIVHRHRLVSRAGH
jgi:N-acetylglucosaminyldiphosphoundecaprenol N-acetyl-beta-D-mannosaminyltransferase